MKESPGPPAAASEQPADLCRRRLEERERVAAHWSRRDRLTSFARLAVAVAGIVAAWLSVQSGLFPLGWLLLPLSVFVVLLVVHERVLRRHGRVSRAAAFYRRCLARMRFVDGDGPWPEDESETPGAEPAELAVDLVDPDHLYAADLDLFGPRSLFELLCRASTASGRTTLARWLGAPADVDEVRARQQAVAELAARLDWREDWAVRGGEVEGGLDPETLRLWASRSAIPGARWLRPLFLLAAVLNVVAAGGWAFLGWGPAPLLALLLVEILGHLAWRRHLQAALHDLERAPRELERLAQLLRLLESAPFESPWLRSRVEALRGGGAVPSQAVSILERRVDLLESRRNPFFAPIGMLLLWTSQWTLAVERWRLHWGDEIARWLETVGEVDALASLAGWAFENPRDPFPEIVEPRAGELPVLEGRALRHPLLPRPLCVPNDVELGSRWQALVVSGSNMSGKSTYLRVTGINVVLALAGAPVCAESLRLTPLAVGASIRIQDSLQEGSSKFYAEITRLRRILGLTEGPLPVYFLLDEILAGTNSHDRRIGADAVLRALFERGAIGLVTTHDLALTRIAEDDALRVRNVHFEDRLEEGRIQFDYRLRDGVVERSNALALMREVGLEV